MNSRRLIASPETQDERSYRCNLSAWRGGARHRCPLWVKSGHMRCNKPCPLYPQYRTL